MSIQDRLRKAIDQLGLNIKEATEKSGIPYRSMQNYLRGEREPNAEALIALATHLGISVDWLLTGKGDARAPIGVGEMQPEYSVVLSPREAAVLGLFRGLDEGAQREIQQVAEEKKRLRDVERRLDEVSERLGEALRRA